MFLDKSRENLGINSFSHIYIEKGAMEYPFAQMALERFANAKRIEISHYKDVFCRPKQDFQLQKKAQKLILAVKTDNFLYRGPEICQDFGNKNFYYTSSLLNCIYNCDYCFLQGMYPSANIVAFVNIEDFFKAVLNHSSATEGPVYLTVSYDSDILAFERVVPFASTWIDFARQHPWLTIEIRTKSANYESLSKIEPAKNVVVAWTLSPQEVIHKYEKQAPTLEARLYAAKQAICNGWNVRLVFDPVIKVAGFEQVYSAFLKQVFDVLPAGRIFDVAVGAFRMPYVYLKKIKKSRTDSDILYYPYTCSNGIATYPPEVLNEVLNFVHKNVSKIIDADKIYLG